MKAQELIDVMMEKQKSASELIEVEVMKSSSPDGQVRVLDKKSAAAKKAVEAAMKDLGSKLEKLGLIFHANINNDYASIDWK